MRKIKLMLSLFITLALPLAMCFGVSSVLAVNNALLLDGDADYVEIIDSPTLNSIDSQVTMEFWMKIESHSNVWMPVVYKGDAYATNYSNRSFSLWTNKYYKNMHFASAPADEGQITLNSSNGSTQLQNWYHVACVIDSTAGFYVDKAKAAHWDGRNEAGETVVSGVYFVVLEAGAYHQIRRMVLVK